MWHRNIQSIGRLKRYGITAFHIILIAENVPSTLRREPDLELVYSFILPMPGNLWLLKELSRLCWILSRFRPPVLNANSTYIVTAMLNENPNNARIFLMNRITDRITDLAPYTFKRHKIAFFPLNVWTICFEDTTIRLMRANKETISDTVFLLNKAYQGGWQARSIYEDARANIAEKGCCTQFCGDHLKRISQ